MVNLTMLIFVSFCQSNGSEKRPISASFLSLPHGTEIGTHGSAEARRDFFCAAGAFDWFWAKRKTIKKNEYVIQET